MITKFITTIACLAAFTGTADAHWGEFTLRAGAAHSFRLGEGGIFNCVNHYDGWALPGSFFGRILVVPGGSERRDNAHDLSLWKVPGGRLVFDGTTFVNWSPTRLSIAVEC